jgi:hypothetical protein
MPPERRFVRDSKDENGWTRGLITLRSAVFLLAVVMAAALGTAIGSAAATNDDWGCPKERIAYSIFTPTDGGGYQSRSIALASLAPFLAADGARTEAEYADALDSMAGPDRFDPESGKVYIHGQIEAQIALTQLDDGTWTIDNLQLCGPPVPPEFASRYPTPTSARAPADAAVEHGSRVELGRENTSHA